MSTPNTNGRLFMLDNRPLVLGGTLFYAALLLRIWLRWTGRNVDAVSSASSDSTGRWASNCRQKVGQSTFGRCWRMRLITSSK